MSKIYKTLARLTKEQKRGLQVNKVRIRRNYNDVSKDTKKIIKRYCEQLYAKKIGQHRKSG